MAKGAWVAVGILALAAVGVGVQDLCGIQAEKRFRETVAEASRELPFPLTITRYDRGLFSARAETQIEFRLPNAAPQTQTAGSAAATTEPPRLVLHHAIIHGPRLSGLRLARIVTTWGWPDSLQAEVDQLFKGQEPVTLISDIGLGGGVSAHLATATIDTTLPPQGARDAPLTLKWSGVEGHFHGDPDHGTITVDLRMPGLEAQQRDQRLAVSALSLSSDMQRSSDSGLWLGSSNAGIDSIVMDSKPDSVRLEKLAIASSSREADGLLQSSLTISADQGSADTVTVRKPLLKFSFSNLDAQSIAQWREQTRALMTDTLKSTNNPQPQAQVQQFADSFGALLPKLLARQPSFSIDELSLDDGRGPVKISGEVRYVGAPAAGQPFKFQATDLEAHGAAELPVAVLDQLLLMKAASELKAQTRPGGAGAATVGNADLAAAAAQARAALVGQSLIVIDGDRAKTEVVFKAGAITVNGKPFQGLPAPAH